MEKANAKKIEVQVESIQEVNFDDVKKSFAGLANREDIQLDPDLMYAKFIMCHEGSNANGDTFTKEVLQRAQYTPRFKPIDWEHGQPFIGTILDSQYAETADGIGYIEAVGAIWKFHYPDLADSIKTNSANGGLKLSMECFYRDANYKYGDQIFNQQQADELGLTDYVGREYMGQKVYRIFSDVIFGGVGVVSNPADKQAVFLSVAKKQSEEELAVAEFNREQNDFTKKQLPKETIDAVTIAKYTKAFDKAKSTIINKFNNGTTSKDLVLADIKNVISTLITEIYSISDDFYKGVASEEGLEELLEEIHAEASKKKAEDNNDIEEFDDEKDKEDLEMEDNATKANSLEEVVEELETEVVEDAEAKKAVDPDNDGDDDSKDPEDKNDKPKAEKSKKKVTLKENHDGQEVKARELESKVAELEAELESKNNALASLQAELDALKNKVEASEREAKANSRMKELADAGVKFSEARKAKELEKISAMDDASFADYKDLLIEIAGVKVEVVEASEVEELVEEVKVENTEVASASLNVETETPKLIKPFGHLVD
jgi:hypothetical protein